MTIQYHPIFWLFNTFFFQDRFSLFDSKFYRNMVDRDGKLTKNDGGDVPLRIYLWPTSDQINAKMEDFRKSLQSELADYRSRYYRKPWSGSDDTDKIRKNQDKVQRSYLPSSNDFDKVQDQSQYAKQSLQSDNLIKSFINEMGTVLNKRRDSYRKRFPQANQLWYAGGQERRVYGIHDFMKDFSSILSS